MTKAGRVMDWADRFIYDTYIAIGHDAYYNNQSKLLFNMDVWKWYAKENKLRISKIDELNKHIELEPIKDEQND